MSLKFTLDCDINGTSFLSYLTISKEIEEIFN